MNISGSLGPRRPDVLVAPVSWMCGPCDRCAISNLLGRLVRQVRLARERESASARGPSSSSRRNGESVLSDMALDARRSSDAGCPDWTPVLCRAAPGCRLAAACYFLALGCAWRSGMRAWLRARLTERYVSQCACCAMRVESLRLGYMHRRFAGAGAGRCLLGQPCLDHPLDTSSQ